MTNKNENEARTMEVPFTEREYRQEVEDLARQIAAEARESGNDRSDVAHEQVDGHEYVIYHWKARFVLIYSDNEDAILEMDEHPNFGCMVELYSAAAYWALLADVNEALADIPEEEDEDAASAEGGAS